MRIGILGSGLMGGKLGTIFARAGHEVATGNANDLTRFQPEDKDATGRRIAVRNRRTGWIRERSRIVSAAESIHRVERQAERTHRNADSDVGASIAG
jgi:3-hydroxyacyl-CoA dehydrogenase